MTKPYTTVSDDQQEILNAIRALYTDGTFDVDATYSTGGFYKDGRVPEPSWKFDINPQRPGVIAADCRDLPLDDSCVMSVIIDLPFLHQPGADSIMGQRFSGVHSQNDLRQLHHDALLEAHRVLMPGGIVVVKCQDVIESGKQKLQHCYVWEGAQTVGFEDLDLFIILKKTTMVGHNWDRQVHARRGHSYFMVFRKPLRGR
jgi:hypothetical protein